MVGSDASVAAGSGGTATVAALIADPVRTAMLVRLADGRALPAGELARAGGVAAPTARAHLAELAAGGLLDVETHGKHRYYRLAGPEVVAVVDQLAGVAPRSQARSSRAVRVAGDLAYARSCYDHLAGSLGVALTTQLVTTGELRPVPGGYEVAPADDGILRRLGLDVRGPLAGRRAPARPCLDWTERRHHLAGALGAALLDRLLELSWLRREDGSRAIRLTAEGSAALHDTFRLPRPLAGPDRAPAVAG